MALMNTRSRPGKVNADANNASTYQAAESNRIAVENFEAYEYARDLGHLDWLDEAKKFDAYYRGEQWEQAVLDYLAEQGRPAQTINLVLSTVNSVLGEQINNRQEIELKPAGDGATEAVAVILNNVIDHVEDDNQSHWKEQAMFTDGLITDRGYVDIRMDFSRSIKGDIKETVLDPKCVIPDPWAEDYDPDTWSLVIVSKWMTPDEISALYGKEKGEQLRYRASSESLGVDSIEWLDNTYGNLTSSSDVDTRWGGDDDDERMQVARVRVIDRQYRKLTRVKYFVDIPTGELKQIADDMSDEEIQQFVDNFGLGVIERVERRIRWTVSAEDVLLSDTWSPYKHFTVVPFFPYFRRGHPFGLVRNLLSAQDMLNKVSSQELHVVNTTANSGWIFESESLVNMDANELEMRGAETGLVLEVKRGAEMPVKIQPNQVPTGLDRISEKSAVYFREISGVNDSLLGVAQREISGVALENRQTRGLMQMEIIFDNLAKTRYRRAQIILDLIQTFYDETRTVILNSRDADGAEMMEELGLNVVDLSGQILNDLTVGRYLIKISTSPVRDTADETSFAQMVQLRELGVAVPDWAVVEMSNLPKKREIVEYMRRLAGAQEPTEEEIALQRQQQELMLRGQLAEVMLREAEVREKMANAQKLIAQAQKDGAAHDAEFAKTQMEILAMLEKAKIEYQTNREDLQARLIIAGEKNATIERVATIESATSRVNEATKSRTQLSKAATGGSSTSQT